MRFLLVVIFAALVVAVLVLGTAVIAMAADDSAAPLQANRDAIAAQLVRERAAHRLEVRDLRKRLRARARTSSYRTAMTLAHIVYGVPVAGLSRLSWCESRHTPSARNSTALSGAHASGAAQILHIPGGGAASTWHTTPYAKLSPFDLVTNMLAAGYIWRRAGGSFREWQDVCARLGDAR